MHRRLTTFATTLDPSGADAREMLERTWMRRGAQTGAARPEGSATQTTHTDVSQRKEPAMLKIYCVVQAYCHQLTTQQPRRDERGLSQSTENAILLAGAAAIALLIIGVITEYVKKHLPQ